MSGSSYGICVNGGLPWGVARTTVGSGAAWGARGLSWSAEAALEGHGRPAPHSRSPEGRWKPYFAPGSPVPNSKK